MKEAFKTIFEGGIGEFEMKKSRFIATVCPVSKEEEALEVIEGLKKKYWDASHNCYAYSLGAENPLLRCSDDGEPARTAGRPMLDVLLAQELTDLVVVVTRYFGGTLLGTGGLVKAYQSATLEGLKQSIIITKELGIRFSVLTDYNMIGRLQYFIASEQFCVLATDYTDLVSFSVLIPPSRKDFFIKKIAELTNGSATVQASGQVYFTRLNGEVHLFKC